MASAAEKIKLTCPHCDEGFHAIRPEAGRKVKCPECGKAFTPDLDDDDNDEAAAVQERPTLKAKSKSGSKSDPDDKPRSKKPRDDDDDGDAPRKKRQRDEDDDADDRPSKKKKGKEKAGGSMMLVVLLLLLGGGFVLSLALLAVGAFVWPGFMVRKADDKVAEGIKPGINNPDKGLGGNKPTDNANKDNAGKDNLPAFLPGGNDVANFVFADADVLIGINVKALRDANQLEPMLKQIDSLQQGKDPMPNEIKDLMRNAERVMMCAQLPEQGMQMPFQPGGGGPGFPPGGGAPGFPPGGGPGFPPGGGGQGLPPGGGGPGFPPGGGQPGGQPKQGGANIKGLIAVLASNAEAVNKIKNMKAMGGAQLLGGKYRVYQPGKTDKNWPDYVAFPGERMILLGSLSEKEMIALLDQVSKNQGSPNEVVKIGGLVEQAHFYGALKFNAKIRQIVQGMEEAARKIPELQPFVGPLQRAKGASLGYDVISNGTSMRIRLNVECANAQDALGLRKAAEPLKDMALGLLQLSGKMPQTVTTDLNTIVFQNQGAVTTVSMQISEKTILELAKLGDSKQGFPGPGGVKDFAKGDGFKKDFPGLDRSNKDFPKLDGSPKDFAKGDGLKKDFPGLDGAKKDFPAFDGFGKDFKKGGQPKSESYTVKQMFSSKTDERPARFTQGKNVTVSINSSITLETTKFDIVVLRGNVGENVVVQKLATGRTGSVSFTVPATDAYRIRVINRGPGTATTCIVNVREQ